ncbi:MAG: AzlD domain-containing protein [Peptococcaceae bacterium]
METGYPYLYVLSAVAVMAIVTYIPRMLPLTLMRRKIQNKFIRSFLYYVPYAVLAAMTIPGILYSTSNMVSAILGLIAAVFLAYKNKGLLLVALGAVAVVFITEQCMLFL